MGQNGNIQGDKIGNYSDEGITKCIVVVLDHHHSSRDKTRRSKTSKLLDYLHLRKRITRRNLIELSTSIAPKREENPMMFKKMSLIK